MPRGASITAEAVCFFRALEQTRPPARRIVDDPFAARMLSPALASLAAMPAVRRSIVATGTAAIGGLQRFVAARHRIIDERMLAFVARGGAHVVILGAGYDTRAWRLADALRGVVVAELDFPATQARKRQVIARQRIPTPAMAPPVFVPIDFEQQRLGDVLATAGYRGDAPIFYIWEGVTMYLDPATVAATLDVLAQAGGPGSELIFDAWAAPGGSGMAAIRRLASGGLRFVGEPLKFSLAPDAASAMLSGSGWQLERVYQPRCIEAALGLPRDTVYPDTHLVHAALR